MFIPLGTDAPIYHRPIITTALILANVAAFWLTSGGTDYESWLLHFGQWNPREWFTAPFLHFGIVHLVGNMVFLWVFGLVVEGKLGWWRFLTLYFVLCAVSGCLTQLLVLSQDTLSRGAGGASGVIYGLLAVALVWAPLNCVEVLTVWFIGMMARSVHTTEVTIRTFALYYIASDLFVSWLRGFAISTPVLHTLGAVTGLPFGILLLRRGWVDCEGWDLLTILREGSPKSATPELYRDRGPSSYSSSQIAVEQRKQCRPENELRNIRRLVRDRQFSSAWTRYGQLRKLSDTAFLDERSLRNLIDGLVDQQEWPMAAAQLQEYIDRFPQRATRGRLTQATILVQQLQRPKAALRTIQEIELQQLTTEQQRKCHAIRRLAERQIADGMLELQELTFAE